MKKWVAIFAVCFLVFQLSTVYVYASELMDKFSVRITVEAENTIYEWEYDSPNRYEYEKGETVLKDERAKAEVINLVRMIGLGEQAKVEEMVNRLKKDRFPSMERFEARFINEEGKLFTWVWKADHAS
ncbi:hypothetical protein [Halalkalibacterium ligniniphilum]|uniref:hypothetical protein n=1 Tax=Halalkalibacterium ligniniphilum TaxID=1134413 RepID=UPI000344FC99|nr:hypothetical protein [Halalkalibacterium ligniniphilum]